VFPNAVIRVQAREIVEAMDPLPTHRAFYTPMQAEPPWARVILHHEHRVLAGFQAVAPRLGCPHEVALALVLEKRVRHC
jgi:hypothetical protein